MSFIMAYLGWSDKEEGSQKSENLENLGKGNKRPYSLLEKSL